MTFSDLVLLKPLLFPALESSWGVRLLWPWLVLCPLSRFTHEVLHYEAMRVDGDVGVMYILTGYVCLFTLGLTAWPRHRDEIFRRDRLMVCSQCQTQCCPWFEALEEEGGT